MIKNDIINNTNAIIKKQIKIKKLNKIEPSIIIKSTNGAIIRALKTLFINSFLIIYFLNFFLLF